jgi:hypothetical protein
MRVIRSLLLVLLCSAPAFAQTGTVRGAVSDESGALVPAAQVTLTGSSGTGKQTTSGRDGSYAFTDVPFGDYTVNVSAPQLALAEPAKVVLNSPVKILNLQLTVASTHQRVTVEDNAGSAVSTESSGNASALSVQGKDLQSLGDDPEDLATDLQALAGPAAGPSGGSFYIDGFSGGQIPSKNSIREVRINQNPFSPEYDALGYGRIEIFTKPGADKLHGNVYDNFWNSRNPYAAAKARFCSTNTVVAWKGRWVRKLPSSSPWTAPRSITAL